MTQHNQSGDKGLHQPWQRSLPVQSICWLSSFSLLGNGLVLAQSESSIDNIVPTVQNSRPAVRRTVKKDIVIPTRSASRSQTTSARKKSSPSRAKLIQRLKRQSSRSSRSSKPVRLYRRKPATGSKPKAPVRKNRTPVVIHTPKPAVRTPKTRATISKPPAANISKPEVLTPKAPLVLRKKKPKVKVNTARPAPRTIPKKLPQWAQPTVSNSPITASGSSKKPKDYNSAYIDPTNYSKPSQKKYQAPNKVILTGRSGACRTLLSKGTGISSRNCVKAPIAGSRNQRVANSTPKPTRATAPSWLRKSQNTNKVVKVTSVPRATTRRSNRIQRRATVASSRSVSNISNSRWRPRRTTNIAASRNKIHPNRFIPSAGNFTPTTTVSSVPIAPSGGTLPPPMTANNTAPRVSSIAYDIPLASTLPRIVSGVTRLAYGVQGLMFPVSVPSPITSVFGWRQHPITGDRRFHSGTDIGAAMGTPILAASTGQVEIADWVGGYGLTVILNHNNAQQTLYGHMSQIFVQPGQVVEQGTVIGRVGSTGNSTGPHLHFELRHLTPQGWVASDPGVHLEYGLSQLLEALQTAQLSQKPEKKSN
ncbi:MAG: peptidoglycan DD-metalloendopeptidase family protein [Nostocaceae cyanobacterium]|nr:peptidoglycan DD-metalloendopeptidase family protein [Nostocaceae cyanobacterium]